MNTFTSILGVIYAQGLMALRENCVMPRLINSDYENDAKQQGDAVNITVASAATTSSITPANTAPNPPDVTPTKVVLTLDQWEESAFQLSDKEIENIFSLPKYKSQQVAEHIKALCNKVNETVFDVYPGVYGFAGTAGTTPFATSTAEATAARKVLNKQLAPLNPRAFVLDPDAEASALGLRAFQDASFRGDTSGVIEGQIGRKLGFQFAMDQQVPTHTAGTITTGLAAKAATAQVVGDETIQCTTAASTGACALLAGDIVHFAGDPQTYVLTANATQASAATDVTLNISPPLKVALAGGEAVTVEDDHVVNLAFHRDAIGFASRPLAGDKGLTAAELENIMQIPDPLSGLTLRLERRREFYRVRYSFSLLWGVKLVRPELITRVAG